MSDEENVGPSRRSCWTCGTEMPERVWEIAPQEPSDPSKRQCIDCHTELEFYTADPLKIMNMIRYAADMPRVPNPLNN